MTAPTPSVYGTSESCVDYIGECVGPRYYAIKSLDRNCNWSDISNVPSGSTPCTEFCSPERPDGSVRPLMFSAKPNPASAFVVIRFAYNGLLEDPAISVFDIVGRRLAELKSISKENGIGVARWDLRGDDGKPVPVGMYFVHLALREDVRVRPLLVVR